MKRDWSELGNSEFAPAEGFGTPDVLIEYDGPQLVLYSVAEKPRYMAIAADWDADTARWLFADVSMMEIEMMALNSLPMRDAFSRKPSLTVVDFDHYDVPQRAWKILIEHVPAGILPKKGSPLPGYARRHLLSTFGVVQYEARRIRLDGAPVFSSKLGLSTLSPTIDALQRLWTAIGRSLGLYSLAPESGLPSTELMASGFGGGSFSVTFEPAEAKGFERILSEYDRLIEAAYDSPNELAVSVEKEVREALLEYATVLETYSLEASVETPKTRSYLSYRSAPLIVSALELLPPTKRARVEKKPPKETKYRGYFFDFNAENSTFVFFALGDKLRLRGKVSVELAKEWRAGVTGAVIKKSAHYGVTIESDRSGKHTLTEFHEVGQMELFKESGRRPATKTPSRSKKK